MVPEAHADDEFLPEATYTQIEKHPGKPKMTPKWFMCLLM
jgi:hypothetical protein